MGNSWFNDLVAKWKGQRVKMKGEFIPWHFPPANKFLNHSLGEQIKHLGSEVKEVERAYFDESPGAFVEEIWDVIHSAETLLWIAHGNGLDITSPKDEVIRKNLARGYYKGGC